MSFTKVDLEVKPEGASGQVLAIPLSSTGSDGKAKTYEVRDEKGASLLKVDATTGKTTLGSIAGAVRLPVYADDTERDTGVPTPVEGMIVWNTTASYIQVYNGSNWVNVGAGV